MTIAAKARGRFVLTFYELDRKYGGPEEGGWWYNTGDLVRVSRGYDDEQQAEAAADRANRLLEYLQRRKRSLGSVLYRGGRHRCEVWDQPPPECWPETRPHYE